MDDKKKKTIERYRQILNKHKKKNKFVKTDDLVVEISSEGYE